MRIQGVSIALAVGLGVLVAAGPVRAQQPDYEAAREHYKQAQLALDRGEFAVAAREFGIAYEITRDPVLFFKIAFAYEKAGDCDAALIYYRRYLKEGKPEDKDRTEAEARVAACEGKAGPATPPEPPPGGDTPPTPPPGGDDPAPGGTVLAPDLAGDPPGPGPGPGPADPPPPGPDLTPAPGAFDDEGGTWKRTAAWIGVGITVAAGTTAAVLGLSASSREEDIDNLIRFRDASGRPAQFSGQTQRRYDELIDEGERYDRYAKIALLATGAAAAGATVLFILEAREPDPAPKTGAGTVSRRRTVTPLVSADGFGFAAGWEF